ncbi:hypothetical protein STRTUCAR8_03670 [Streptomyces turgidiscabies Car8]|uniref:Uncharacterized protein n=1 Tax=Streptomyces turgidiscabies (strain Car8) TaxID=698760 RepID=L7EPU0_STRT8|nr:hypothetical protein STRTUCAR8_03670 [Streptomyces turgidiscabies Car8]
MEAAADVLVHSRKDREFAASTWLLAAALDMREARAAWEKRNGIALLRCGGIFGAVRLSTDLVRAAAATENTAEVDAFLAQVLHGAPVFTDQFSQWYYVLVPVSTGRRQEWETARLAPKAEFLGSNTFLGVPRPDVTEPEGVRSYWCVPMDGPGALAVPDRVSQLVAVARFRQAATDNPAPTPAA